MILLQLTIENIAVIEKACVEFGAGLNVLTGETGAGKSLVFDSVNAVLGNRTSREMIRAGAQTASVTAAFYAPEAADALLEQGLSLDEGGTLVLSRVMYSDGRNVCRANGNMISLSQLRQITARLAVIHGQNDSQNLLEASRHIELLDKYAENGEILEKYQRIFDKYTALQERIREFESNLASRSERIELLEARVSELDRANVKTGEEDALESRRDALLNYEKLYSLLDAAHEASDRAREFASGAMRAIEDASAIDAALSGASDSIKESYYLLEGAIGEISSYRSRMSFDASELERIEARLDEIYKLKRKYNCTADGLCALLEEFSSELEHLTLDSGGIEALREEASGVYIGLVAAAAELRASREKAASELCERVNGELSRLDMVRAALSFPLYDKEMTRGGGDGGELMIVTNPSEEPKPLSRIASGGEMSRVMLALRSVFAASDGIGTLLFDEIDSGVSGRAASRIADRLAALAKTHQVICVTHLAQIASAADVHLLIEKDTATDSFSASVTRLEGDDRVREIARIIGGEHVSNLTMQSAKELLEAAHSAVN